jgi:predicted Fe-S protein YdhL (DUF1289 family)
MLQKEVKPLPVLQDNVKCNLECYYDKELKCCGSCFRTLEEIAEAGKRKKND